MTFKAMRNLLNSCFFSCSALIFLFFLSKAQAELSYDINQIKQDYNLMGGAALIYNSSQNLISVPFGMADYQRQIAVNDSTLFRIASISKMVTALAYMQLIDNGLAGLDSDIGTILGYQVRNPYYPAQSITPRMLMSHKSGILDGATYSDFLNATSTINPMPGLHELLTPTGSYYSNSLFNSILPGTYFNYSNINFVILATLIEKISGERFDEYCRNHILLPLGIKGSFNVNHITDLNQLAVLYRRSGGVWSAQADNYQGIQPVFTNLSDYLPGTNGARFSPQGGLRCSAGDLSKIMMLFLNEGTYNGTRIISADKINLMSADEWSYNGSNGNNYYNLFNSWGLGIHRIKNIVNADVVLSGSQIMFGHPGEAYGLVSDAYLDPIRKHGIIFITNGCWNGFQTGTNSAFYTVEKAVFSAMDPYVDSLSSNPQMIEHLTGYKQTISSYPNPFNNQTVINYELAVNSPVKLTVFNSKGEIIEILQNANLSAGLHSAVFKADGLNSGIYYCQLEVNNRVQTIKILLLK